MSWSRRRAIHVFAALNKDVDAGLRPHDGQRRLRVDIKGDWHQAIHPVAPARLRHNLLIDSKVRYHPDDPIKSEFHLR